MIRIRPSLRTASRPASDVMFTTAPCELRSSGSASCTSASGATTFDLVHVAQHVERVAASAGCGDGPSTLALFTRRSSPPSSSAAATSASRCRGIGDVAGDGTATTVGVLDELGGDARRARVRPAGVEDERPPVEGEGARQREPEARGRRR